MTTSKILTIFFIIFVTYTVISKNASKIEIPWLKTTSNTVVTNSDIRAESQDKGSVVGNIAASLINKVLENPHGKVAFEEVLTKMVSGYHQTLGQDMLHKEFLYKDQDVGVGEELSCGDTATVAYKIKGVNDKEDIKTFVPFQKSTIVVGSRKINKALENGMIGMKEGGVRNILFAPKDNATLQGAGDTKTENKISETKLLKIDKKYSSTKTWKTFIDKNAFTDTGPKILCGDTVSVYYSVENIEGVQLFDSRKTGKALSFTIGSANTPAPISEALLGIVKQKSKVFVLTDTPDKIVPLKLKQKLQAGLVVLDTRPYG